MEIFFAEKNAVEACSLSICDLQGLDDAIMQLCLNPIIGVNVLWQPELVMKQEPLVAFICLFCLCIWCGFKKMRGMLPRGPADYMH